MEWAQLVIGLVAALATLWAVWYAREAARSGKDAVDAAKETVEASERSRLADERDRRGRRLERVGELVEHMAAAAGRTTLGSASRAEWWFARDQLALALVGFGERLPACAALLDARDEGQVDAGAKAARAEVEAALREVDAEP